jgi:hypothetical protein
MLPKCWLRLRCMRAYALASSPVDVRGAGEIERAVTPFARGSNGGVIVTGSAMAVIHRQTITALAARHRLPAVYSETEGFFRHPTGPIGSTSSAARPVLAIFYSLIISAA